MSNGPQVSLSAPAYGGASPPSRFNMAAHALASGEDGKTAIRIFSGADPEAPPREITYARLRARVCAVAAGLGALALPARSVIAIRQNTGIDYAVCYLAIAGAGHVALALSPMLTVRETRTICETAGVAAVIRDEALDLHDVTEGIHLVRLEEVEALGRDSGAAGAQALAATAAGDPAYLVFTSGTGASPKGVLHAHRAAFARRPMYRDWYDARRSDVFLHTGAMNWTYALGTGLVDPLVLGATATFVDAAPEAAAWKGLLERSGATILASVPGLFRQILRDNADLGEVHALRHALTAGEALRAGLHDDWVRATGKPICEAFGMSEISTYISTPPGLAWKAGSPGRPQHGRAVAILPSAAHEQEGGVAPVGIGETGILAVHRSDPGMMLRYLGADDAAHDPWRGDWFMTGDLAVMDSDGYVFPQGRADDVMNVMGYRVSPAEVESQLLACPGVLDAAVASLSPREGVSIITAYVVAEPQTVAAGPEALLAEAAKRLARYKQPREVRFVDALPRTPNGKIRRSRLRDL